jgi:NhaP-type Na+/H+ or K+/H+ antiporter
MPRKKESDNFNLKEFFISFIETFIKKVGGEIIEDIKEKAHEISQELKRKATTTTFLIFGLIFLLVGFSLFLESLFHIKGFGYILVGFILILIGLLINIKK